MVIKLPAEIIIHIYTFLKDFREIFYSLGIFPYLEELAYKQYKKEKEQEEEQERESWR